MTWIKICATTNLRDAQASIAAGANALGFIFAPSRRRIEIGTTAEIIAALPAEIEKIGVFVNETPEHVAVVAAQLGLTGCQLHGDEPVGQVAKYRQALGSRKLIKTLQARELLSHGGDRMLQGYLEASGSIDAILLDSGRPGNRGGTGLPFDWEMALPIVQKIKAVLPVIIAGGLTAENVSQAIRLFDPWGVDVVSGVERETGRKDETKLRNFVAAARQVESAVRIR
ncbi:MAG TPA: phosphoribosylanthranilate isomerase [Terriglobales bacterium]|nr:phosphoribosylanthranilate isomerase [Terriglobales bacterium]